MITIVKLGARKQRRDNDKYSFVNRTIKLWNEVTAEALATFTCKSLIFIRRVRKWGEVKGFWNVVTKPPKVQGCEKWRVKCSEVKWNEVMILGEMCVLSLIYIYVAVCRFCAVHCLFIIWFSWLFSNYLTTLQTGRSWVRFPMVSFEIFSDIILPAALWPLGSTQPLTEMSTKCISWG